MQVGPYTIKRRTDVEPPDGLAFVPTLEPELSDDADTYTGRRSCGAEMSPCNVALILEAIRDARLIVEIGVQPPGVAFSVSKRLMDEKPPGCAYIGIDLDSRRQFANPAAGIYILTTDSRNRQLCYDLMADIGRDEIDVLLIDGWHSVNQCLADWQYTEKLAPDGVVLLHDIHWHPGPAALLAAIDPQQWHAFDGCPDDGDYGLGVIGRRHD